MCIRDIFSYICISRKDQARERNLIDSLIDRLVDGILLVPINNSADFCAHLRGLNLPVVAMSNRPVSYTHLDVYKRQFQTWVQLPSQQPSSQWHPSKP